MSTLPFFVILVLSPIQLRPPTFQLLHKVNYQTNSYTPTLLHHLLYNPLEKLSIMYPLLIISHNIEHSSFCKRNLKHLATGKSTVNESKLELATTLKLFELTIVVNMSMIPVKPIAGTQVSNIKLHLLTIPNQIELQSDSIVCLQIWYDQN